YRSFYATSVRRASDRVGARFLGRYRRIEASPEDPRHQTALSCQTELPQSCSHSPGVCNRESFSRHIKRSGLCGSRALGLESIVCDVLSPDLVAGDARAASPPVAFVHYLRGIDPNASQFVYPLLPIPSFGSGS